MSLLCESSPQDCHAITEIVISNLTIGSLNGLAAGTTTWLGHTITQIYFFSGAGFGALAGIVAWATMHFMEEHFQIDNDWITVPFSYMTSGIVVYTGCAATAAAGLTAPITIPTAALLTTASFVSLILFSEVIKIDFSKLYELAIKA